MCQIWPPQNQKGIHNRSQVRQSHFRQLLFGLVSWAVVLGTCVKVVLAEDERVVDFKVSGSPEIRYARGKKKLLILSGLRCSSREIPFMGKPILI
jgi:hypothetical protein